MAAFDSPINDPYLSHLHQSSLDSSRHLLAMSESHPTPNSSDNPAPSLLTSSKSSSSIANPSTSHPLINPHQDLNSTQILENVPTPVLRLLAAWAPAIHLLHSFIRLATWTAGPGSSGSSASLVFAWWLICAFGYELIRYAPQLLILSSIAYSWVASQVGSASNKAHPKKSPNTIVTSATINATLHELSELADFFSVLRSSVILPAVRLVSWDPSPARTRATAVFVLTTWPLWLLLFLPWQHWQFPSLHLLVDKGAVFKALSFLYDQASGLASSGFSLAVGKVGNNNPKAAAFLLKAKLVLVQTVLPAVSSVVGYLSTLFGIKASHFSLSILPPFPIGALSVRSLMLILGTLALTWCSPWCGLVRQAVWKSSTIRRVVRASGKVLSGQAGLREAWGRGRETHVSTLGDENKKVNGQAVRNEQVAQDDESSSKVTRHEDVVYQFSIFENQRWWVGLDWTAALLPQERPSWSDESNNAVSPPSSFSLPPARVVVTPSPTADNPRACTRRTVKWQWLDPEWTVAGAGFISSTVYRPPTSLGASDAAVVSAKASGDQQAIAAAKQGYIGDALNRIRSVRSASASAAAASNAKGSTPISPTSSRNNDDSASSFSEDFAAESGGSLYDSEPSVTEVLDVDSEGWQYGDNAWDKMSKKAGIGRYTRRRKWIRRAVLLEIVERDVTPEEEGEEGEDKKMTKNKGRASDPTGNGGTLDSETKPEGTSPSDEKPTASDLKVRLNEPSKKADGGGAGASTSFASAVAASPGNRTDLKERLMKATQK